MKSLLITLSTAINEEVCPNKTCTATNEITPNNIYTAINEEVDLNKTGIERNECASGIKHEVLSEITTFTQLKIYTQLKTLTYCQYKCPAFPSDDLATATKITA